MLDSISQSMIDSVESILTEKKVKKEEAGDFNFAAAKAKLAGKSKFDYEGKTYPVTIDKDDAESIVKAAEEGVEEELEKDSDDPCWKGYVQVGTKMKNGKEVPNCVPKEETVKEEADLKEARRRRRLSADEKKALELGKKAFKAGKERAAMMGDKELQKLGGSTSVGLDISTPKGKKLAKAWFKGWDIANFDEPLGETVKEEAEADDDDEEDELDEKKMSTQAKRKAAKYRQKNKQKIKKYQKKYKQQVKRGSRRVNKKLSKSMRKSRKKPGIRKEEEEISEVEEPKAKGERDFKNLHRVKKYSTDGQPVDESLNESIKPIVNGKISDDLLDLPLKKQRKYLETLSDRELREIDKILQKTVEDFHKGKMKYKWAERDFALADMMSRIIDDILFDRKPIKIQDIDVTPSYLKGFGEVNYTEHERFLKSLNKRSLLKAKEAYKKLIKDPSLHRTERGVISHLLLKFIDKRLNESVQYPLEEKAASKKQQRLMGMAYALKKGEMDRDEASDEVKRLADTMSLSDLKDFAETEHDDLPTQKESVEPIQESTMPTASELRTLAQNIDEFDEIPTKVFAKLSKGKMPTRNDVMSIDDDLARDMVLVMFAELMGENEAEEYFGAEIDM